MGWEGLWDSSGMVGLRGVPETPFSPRQDSGWEGLWDSSGVVGLRGVPETPFSPRQDAGDGKDLGR